MSRLFAVTKSLGEIVAHFAVDIAPALGVPSETIEGTPGLIVLEKDVFRASRRMSRAATSRNYPDNTSLYGVKLHNVITMK